MDATHDKRVKKRYDGLIGWRYSNFYERKNCEDAAWIDEKYGAIKADTSHIWNVGRANIIGYDLVAFVRKFLKDAESTSIGQEIKKKRGIDLSKLSVAEFILIHPDFADLRKFVSDANLYWSHIQCEPFLGRGRDSTCAFFEHNGTFGL